MATNEVKFSLKEWENWLGELKFEKAATRGLLSGAMAALPILHTATDNAPPASRNGSIGAVNTGRFRRSWKSSRIERGVAIVNNATYAPVIEGGRRPGAKMPPQKPLEGWARKKLGVPSKEAKNAAFLMARAIKRRGLKARNVLKSSLPAIRKVVIREVMHELRRELKTP